MSNNDLNLSHYTYIKTGGPADEIIIANSVSELEQAVINCRQKKQKFFILGGGSNTLFTDAGFRGAVIINHASSITIDSENHTLTAASGTPMNMIVNQAAEASLSGLEPFLGLPGTIGGAIFNNSHYKEALMADIVAKVEILDESNQRTWLPVESLDFAYDYSRFQQTKEVILSVVLNLKPGDKEQIQHQSQQYLKSRHDTQPLSNSSSGCIFQNPPDQAAGALIDKAGLKGTQIGGAMVSPIHANFIVNTGSASSADIEELAKKVESTVYNLYGIKLKREVFFIQEDGERAK